MAEMVQNLLDANRIERGEMQLHLVATDLAAVVAAVIETQRPRAAAKQQTIHFAERSRAGRRCWRMRPCSLQVIENLVSNAVKYSPPGKNIFVRLKKSPEAVRLRGAG